MRKRTHPYADSQEIYSTLKGSHEIYATLSGSEYVALVSRVALVTLADLGLYYCPLWGHDITLMNISLFFISLFNDSPTSLAASLTLSTKRPADPELLH